MTEAAAGNLSIRACRLEDIGAVLELWRQGDATPGVTDTTDDLRRAVADSPAHVLVAEVEGRLGVDEDPVCGSARCCLVHFWRKRLGKSAFVAFQVSARGGVVKVRVVKDRVFLSGKATTVAKGEVLAEGDEP